MRASLSFDQLYTDRQRQTEAKCALCGQTLRAFLLLVARVSSPLEIPVVLRRTVVVHLSVQSSTNLFIFSSSSFSGDYVSFDGAIIIVRSMQSMQQLSNSIIW